MAASSQQMQRSRRSTTLRRALRAELTKLRTLRSTWTAGLVAVVACAGVAALNSAGDASNWKTVTIDERAGFDPVRSALFSVIVCALTFGSLGVRSMSAEYSTGMIRVSVAAIHHRSRLVLAKAALIAGYALVTTLLANTAALLVGGRMLAHRGVNAPMEIGEGVVAVALGALATSALGVIGLSLGTLLRRPAAADIAFAVFLIGAQMFTPVLSDTTHKYIPMNVVLATVTTKPVDEALSPLIALAVITAYASAALLAASQIIVRRDA